MSNPDQDRIRGRALQRIRKRHFSRNPLCVHCQAKGRITAATQLDHIIPIHKGGEDTESNRQGLCNACHDIKTSKDVGYTLKGCDKDGQPTNLEHNWWD